MIQQDEIWPVAMKEGLYRGLNRRLILYQRSDNLLKKRFRKDWQRTFSSQVKSRNGHKYADPQQLIDPWSVTTKETYQHHKQISLYLKIGMLPLPKVQIRCSTRQCFVLDLNFEFHPGRPVKQNHRGWSHNESLQLLNHIRFLFESSVVLVRNFSLAGPCFLELKNRSLPPPKSCWSV